MWRLLIIHILHGVVFDVVLLTNKHQTQQIVLFYDLFPGTDPAVSYQGERFSHPTSSLPKFPHVSLGVDGLWATKSEGVGLIFRAISFQDFQPM